MIMTPLGYNIEEFIENYIKYDKEQNQNECYVASSFIEFSKL